MFICVFICEVHSCSMTIASFECVRVCVCVCVYVCVCAVSVSAWVVVCVFICVLMIFEVRVCSHAMASYE